MNTTLSETNTYKCEQCGTDVKRFPSDIRGKHIFCSKPCSATFYNKERIIVKNCLGCNKSFHPIRGGRGKYCSNKCHWQHNRTIIFQKIESGIYISTNSSILKQYLIEKRGDKCELCGWNKTNPKTQKTTLQVDHVDGNAENNNPENIRLICPNCHSLTPNFMNLNKGQGRAIRRLRYKSLLKGS